METLYNGVSKTKLSRRSRETNNSAIAIIIYRREGVISHNPSAIFIVKFCSGGRILVPRLRNQDGIEKGISRLQLKLPTSISISAPIYSHRPYKRVCSYIGFSLSLSLSPPIRANTRMSRKSMFFQLQNRAHLRIL